MTKAKEALDSFNKGVFVHSDAETIREALELLDKVQKQEQNSEQNIKAILDKYILIERK